MSILFTLFILLGIFFLMIVIAGLFLPSKWVIEKAELIEARPKDIFPLINSLEEWSNWTVWSSDNRNSDLNFEYEGKRTGLGAVQVWKSNKMNARLTITQSTIDKEVQYQFDIIEGDLVLLGTIVLAPADVNYTQIAWRCQLKELEGNNPIRRYQAFFMKKYFDTTIESSIISLQSIFGNERLPEED